MKLGLAVLVLAPTALVLLTACGQTPQVFADCASVADPVAREECRFTLAQALLEQPQALDAAIASVDDVESRDLLLLRLATAAPTRASQLCTRVTTPGAAEKCRQVLGRPHLSTTPQPHR